MAEERRTRAVQPPVVIPSVCTPCCGIPIRVSWQFEELLVSGSVVTRCYVVNLSAWCKCVERILHDSFRVTPDYIEAAYDPGNSLANQIDYLWREKHGGN